MSAPAEVVRHLCLGYATATADLLWLRLIQDIDHKEEVKNPRFSWVFHMVDAITTLDPRYRIVYATALSVLSVLIGDVEGSSLLYARATDRFPNDWPILYRAGYHFLYEAHDCAKAADYFKRAASNGAPDWVYGLASRIYSRAGQLQIAVTTLQDAIKKFEGKPQQQAFIDRLKQLEEWANSPAGKNSPVDCAVREPGDNGQKKSGSP